MKKTIGILGGMGPLATADLYRKIILSTDANSDNDHIRVYIDGNSAIPDRTRAILYGDPFRRAGSCAGDAERASKSRKVRRGLCGHALQYGPSFPSAPAGKDISADP